MNTRQRIAVIVGVVIVLSLVIAEDHAGDWVRLVVQIVIVATVPGVAFVLLGGDKGNPQAPTPDQRIPSKDQ